MVDTQGQIGRADSPDSPIGLAGEGLLLVLGGRHNVDLVTVDIGRLSLEGRDLRRRFCRFLQFGRLLSLDRRRRYVHSQNYVA